MHFTFPDSFRGMNNEVDLVINVYVDSVHYNVFIKKHIQCVGTWMANCPNSRKNGIVGLHFKTK